MKDVYIFTETITLGQFLKWASIVQTGGEAKILIQQGLVSVNGKVETQRGRKLKENDIVTVKGQGDFIVKRKIL
ncbi:MAG: S4 domain-containing protein YaaA [bacterium]|nr:S4 domain-containing protein YaaA [bacterium]